MKQQCSAVAWDGERKHLLIGLNNGKIQVIQLMDDYLSFSLVASLQMHSTRVTGIYNTANLLECLRVFAQLSFMTPQTTGLSLLDKTNAFDTTTYRTITCLGMRGLAASQASNEWLLQGALWRCVVVLSCVRWPFQASLYWQL